MCLRFNTVAPVAAEYEATKISQMLHRLAALITGGEVDAGMVETNGAANEGSLAMPQFTSNDFRLIGLHAFPTQTVSIVPAHKSIDHALAGRTDR
jgi:hypothetical protein